MKLQGAFILCISLFLSVSGARSQTGIPSPKDFKEALAVPDPETGSRVIVRESADISSFLNKPTNGHKKIRGYRVRIFFDNSQQARANAQATLARFKESFPDIPADMIYENPYFKVAVGNCLTMDEAMIVWGRVKDQFPQAVPAREDLPLEKLIEGPAEPASENSEDAQ